MPRHIHSCLSIPPTRGVARKIRFLKGQSAVRLYRELSKDRRQRGLNLE